jgi:hypothetical protein
MVLPSLRGFVVLSSSSHVLEGRPLSASFFLSSSDAPLKFAPCPQRFARFFFSWATLFCFSFSQ